MRQSNRTHALKTFNLPFLFCNVNIILLPGGWMRNSWGQFSSLEEENRRTLLTFKINQIISVTTMRDTQNAMAS